MKYLFTDFYALSACGGKQSANFADILREMSWSMMYPVEYACLSAALAALEAGGFVTISLENGYLTSNTAVTLTERGKAALAISWTAKLTKKGTNAANRRKLAAFCAMERPHVSAFPVRGETFADVYAELCQEYGEMRLFSIRNEDGGGYTLTLHRVFSACMDESDDSDIPESGTVAVTTSAEDLQRTLHDLCDTALALTDSRQMRKVALIGGGQGYVLTVGEMFSDKMNQSVLRLTVAPILYNRQRFVGKRDSDLDYAQCGAPIITLTFESRYEFCGLVLAGLSMRPDLQDAALTAKIALLYEQLKRMHESEGLP